MASDDSSDNGAVGRCRTPLYGVRLRTPQELSTVRILTEHLFELPWHTGFMLLPDGGLMSCQGTAALQ